MVSDLADGLCVAVGVVGERGVVDEFDDAERVSGEVDEAKGVTGAASVPPAPRTATANASDALTKASASEALRMVSPEPCGAAGRESMLYPLSAD
jgi:hypothetical protein